MRNNQQIIDRLTKANNSLVSPLITDAVVALRAHPTTVTEDQLDQARKDGAVEALRAVLMNSTITRQKGHPEEETREFDNVDVRYIAERLGVSVQDVWRGI